MTAPTAPTTPRPTTGWHDLLDRVSQERGLLPVPPEVHETLMRAGVITAAVVDDVCRRLIDPVERGWVAAMLAALSHQIQLTTLPPPAGSHES